MGSQRCDCLCSAWWEIQVCASGLRVGPRVTCRTAPVKHLYRDKFPCMDKFHDVQCSQARQAKSQSAVQHKEVAVQPRLTLRDGFDTAQHQPTSHLTIFQIYNLSVKVVASFSLLRSLVRNTTCCTLETCFGRSRTCKGSTLLLTTSNAARHPSAPQSHLPCQSTACNIECPSS